MPLLFTLVQNRLKLSHNQKMSLPHLQKHHLQPTRVTQTKNACLSSYLSSDKTLSIHQEDNTQIDFKLTLIAKIRFYFYTCL